ncbi:MAG: GDP-mannose 4,6-dehydratase, partial [Elusimicrobiales bacterium]|nr:GDP-mannose 4,6-dehydratase [Elusimicrobiales bacterium]
MKALITGAAGFIGSWLARMLRQDGAELVLIDNFSYGKEDNLVFEEHDFTKEVIRMDIRDRDGIKSIMQAGDIDYVYNIAGIA